MLLGRLQVLNQKKAQYVAVRDIPYLLCPENSKPMINIRFIFGEDDEDITRVVFRCATCALLTAPAGARLSITMGLETTEALEVMNYEDDDGEEASAFLVDRVYFNNRVRASTDGPSLHNWRPGALAMRNRMVGMFGDSVYFNDHFPLVRKLLVRPIVAAFLVSTTSGVDALPTTT